MMKVTSKWLINHGHKPSQASGCTVAFHCFSKHSSSHQSSGGSSSSDRRSDPTPGLLTGDAMNKLRSQLRRGFSNMFTTLNHGCSDLRKGIEIDGLAHSTRFQKPIVRWNSSSENRCVAFTKTTSRYLLGISTVTPLVGQRRLTPSFPEAGQPLMSYQEG